MNYQCKEDLHSSSLMNNKNNSVADIIMTTPSFDPGSKLSAVFLENSNDGIVLKNFSLGAANAEVESEDMILSPSQKTQSVTPYTVQAETSLVRNLATQL